MFFKLFSGPTSKKRRIYLDYAAATPVDARVLANAGALLNDPLGNPGALHAEGVQAARVVADARARIAKAIRAHSDEIIFTSSASAANNLALRGTVTAWLARGIPASAIEIFSSEFEHPSVSNVITALQKEYGIRVTQLTGAMHTEMSSGEMPAHNMFLDIQSFAPHVETRACLLTCMYVQNEIGVVLPIRDLSKRVRTLRKDRPDLEIIFHTDATQAPNTFALDVQTLGVDLLSVGSTKLYTHRGIGMLYKKRSINLAPLIIGGNQESGLIAGTEPVYLLDSFSHALVYAQTHAEYFHTHYTELQTFFEKEITEKIPSATISFAHSGKSGKVLERSPHITHVSIPNIDSELLVIELDARGIAVSSHSACTDEVPDDSFIKHHFGPTTGVLRFSFGRTTTKKDLGRAIDALTSVLKKYTLLK